MSSIRLVGSTALALVLAVALAGCGGSAPTATGTAQANEGTTVGPGRTSQPGSGSTAPAERGPPNGQSTVEDDSRKSASSSDAASQR